MQIKKVNVEATAVSLDDVQVDPAYLKKVIDSLEECNSQLKTTIISNTELKKKLQEEDVIKVNFRGGCSPGSEFSNFKDRVENLL